MLISSLEIFLARPVNLCYFVCLTKEGELRWREKVPVFIFAPNYRNKKLVFETLLKYGQKILRCGEMVFFLFMLHQLWRDGASRDQFTSNEKSWIFLGIFARCCWCWGDTSCWCCKFSFRKIREASLTQCSKPQPVRWFASSGKS